MGGGTKRMSADEKRKVVLGIYHETKSVYTEKEILTLASKAGVNANTVADINQSLVDDGLVDKEKIGGSNYFWSFPAKKDFLRQQRHEQNLESIAKVSAEVQEATAKLADAKRGREDNEEGERGKKLQRLNDIDRKRKAMQDELASLKENDPQAIADLEETLKLVREAAHRWTDNIWECQTYLIKKRNMDPKDVNRFLQINGDFDYPEDKIPK